MIPFNYCLESAKMSWVAFNPLATQQFELGHKKTVETFRKVSIMFCIFIHFQLTNRKYIMHDSQQLI